MNSVSEIDARVVEAFLNYERTALVGRLLQGVVHNLAGALQQVRLPLDLLELRLGREGNPDVAKHLQSLQQGITRVTEEVELLAAKGSQSGDVEPRPLDLTQFAREQLAFWRADMFFKHEVELETDLPYNPARVRASYLDLSLAFNQVISNALEAMANGSAPSLRIELVEEAAQAGLKIIDSGPGPDRETVDRLFQPFTSSKGGKHMGMGLFLAKKALGKWGGSLSWDKGKPTCFTIMLQRTA